MQAMITAPRAAISCPMEHGTGLEPADEARSTLLEVTYGSYHWRLGTVISTAESYIVNSLKIIDLWDIERGAARSDAGSRPLRLDDDRSTQWGVRLPRLAEAAAVTSPPGPCFRHEQHQTTFFSSFPSNIMLHRHGLHSQLGELGSSRTALR